MGKKRTKADIKKKLEENKISGVGNRQKLTKEYISAWKKEKGIK